MAIKCRSGKHTLN